MWHTYICNIHAFHKRILQGFCILLFSVIYWRPTSSSRQRRDQWRLLLSTAVQCDAVLLGDGCQLFQELSIQDDGKHSAFGLRGNGWAGRQDTQRRQRQSVPQGAVGQGRVQDEVPSLRLEAFWDTREMLCCHENCDHAAVCMLLTCYKFLQDG